VKSENEKEKKISAKNIIISTGSRPKYFPNIIPDAKRIITSREAMILKEKPTSIAIIGAGAIGIEFAHFYNSFGTKVTIIESMTHILPNEDKDVADELAKIFNKRGIEIITGELVDSVENQGGNIEVVLKSKEKIISDYAIVAVGAQSNIENIGLEKVGIKTKYGSILVNQYLQTNEENIFAIGDVVGPPMLAHKASREAIVAVEKIANKDPEPMKYDNIPSCVYSNPEIASVGLTEKKALEAGYKIKVGKFPFRALGKSMASGETDGFVKVIYDEKYGEMIGCHIIGFEATNLITEATIARRLETTWHEVLETIHPHPTLSEGLLEATADALGEAIHI
jgi:dihydrolipoamide dehydrogenase